MLSIINIIKEADARKQSWVDATAFWCMHAFRVTKGFLRSAVMSIAAICSGAQYFVSGKFYGLMGSMVFGIMAVLMQEAEDEAPAGYVGNRPSLPIEKVFLFIVLFIGLIRLAWMLHMKPQDEDALQESFIMTEMVIITTACLTDLYLYKTPRKPPPRKKREEAKALKVADAEA